MIVYYIHGIFYEGMTWEDFYSHIRNFCSRRTKRRRALQANKWRYPSVTIVAENKETISEKDRFGWINATVPVLNKKSAIKILAQINKCEPKEIKIIERNISIAML